jgi:hypothetical protein
MASFTPKPFTPMTVASNEGKDTGKTNSSPITTATPTSGQLAIGAGMPVTREEMGSSTDGTTQATLQTGSQLPIGTPTNQWTLEDFLRA